MMALTSNSLILLIITLIISAVSTHRVGSCVERCGEPQDRRQQCQCDSQCESYTDCCDDFSVLCNITSVGNTSDSCEGRCGAKYSKSDSCHCGVACGRYRNCCEDYIDFCLPNEDESCLGKCGVYVPGAVVKCHCNGVCTVYGDCCDDHALLCRTEETDISDEELMPIGNWLWSADRYRMRTAELTISKQNRTTVGSSDDMADQRLFTHVDEEVFRYPSYSLYIDLLDNYNAINGELEPNHTADEREEINSFLKHTVGTDVMKILTKFLKSKKRIDTDEDIDSILRQLWFTPYPRSPKLNFSDSSGFEHVFVGEKSSTKAKGFHNWVQMYLLEKEGVLNYWGYNYASKPRLLDAHFSWDGLEKRQGSMFIGTSPQFDMAIYTLCMIARPGKECHTSIRRNTVKIQSYAISHALGRPVATTFPIVRG